jgi:hypothetical protein
VQAPWTTLVCFATGLGCSGGPRAARAAPSDGGLADVALPPSAGVLPCGNPTIDPHNCGACGVDCEGGACEDGACVPLAPGLLATAQSLPTAIAIDDANVYWAVSEASFGDSILKCAKTGCGNAPEIVARGRWGSPPNLVVRANRLYWGGSSALYECATSGGAVTVDSVSGGAVGTVAVDSQGNVFFVNQGQASVNEVGPDLRGGTQLTLLGNPGDGGLANLGAIAIDATTLFAVSTFGAQLAACDLSDCEATAVVREVSQFTGSSFFFSFFAFDAFNVYVVAGIAAQIRSGSILSVPRSGLSPFAGSGFDMATTLVSSVSAPTAIAADGTSVYFADRGDVTGSGAGASGVGRIGKCPVAGCNGAAVIIKDYVSDPAGIAVDSTNVYFTQQNLSFGTSNNGTVSVLAK